MSTATSSTNIENTPFGERNAALDGVRGIAILLVLVFHAVKLKPDVYPIDWLAYQLTMSMWCGVDLFFVLSGFLITGILLDSRGGNRYFTNFYMRRTLRIFPLYYGALVAVFVVYPLVFALLRRPVVGKELYDTLWTNQFYAWTYTSNFVQAWGAHRLPGMGHFWSLAIEEQFYLAWPLCVYLMAPRTLLRFSVGLVIAVLALRIGMELWSEPLRQLLLANGWKDLPEDYLGLAIRQLTFTRVDTLVMGGIGAMIVRRPELLASVKPMLPAVMGTMLVSLGIVWVCDGLLDAERPAMYTTGYTSLAILFCSGLILVATNSSPPSVMRLLQLSSLRTLGKYSYGLYVYHWPIKFLCMGIVAKLGLKTASWLGTGLLDGLIQLVMISVLSLIVAIISWNIWEMPWLRLKKYFAYDDAKRVAAKSAGPIVVEPVETLSSK